MIWFSAERFQAEFQYQIAVYFGRQFTLNRTILG